MTWMTTAKRLRMALTVCVVAYLPGCGTPPSVAPLLRVTERALVEETDRLAQDAERDAAHARQTLETLEDAYARDLERAEPLTPAWVRDATTVYVAAREALIRHEQALVRERGERANNLRTAGVAIRRAAAMIEQQDRIFRGVVGDELHSLLQFPDFVTEEPRP